MSRAPADRALRLRRRKFFRSSGINGRPDNFALKIHLKELSAYISVAEIARRSGIPEGTVWHQLNGSAEACYIPTLQALMKVRLTAADREKLTQEQRMWGAYRIVQGLAALGWTGQVIGETCGLTVYVVRASGRTPTPRYLNQTGEQTYRALWLGAQKLERLDPVKDGGIPRKVHLDVKARAKTRGAVPLGYWDLDTIHDPAARPEFTGECGTSTGYGIHKREGIPLCPPCEEAGDGQLHFSGAKFRKLREERGYSRRMLCERFSYDESTIFYWETGRSVPRRRKIDPVLAFLDASFEDVCE